MKVCNGTCRISGMPLAWTVLMLLGLGCTAASDDGKSTSEEAEPERALRVVSSFGEWSDDGVQYVARSNYEYGPEPSDMFSRSSEEFSEDGEVSLEEQDATFRPDGGWETITSFTDGAISDRYYDIETNEFWHITSYTREARVADSTDTELSEYRVEFDGQRKVQRQSETFWGNGNTRYLEEMRYFLMENEPCPLSPRFGTPTTYEYLDDGTLEADVVTEFDDEGLPSVQYSTTDDWSREYVFRLDESGRVEGFDVLDETGTLMYGYAFQYGAEQWFESWTFTSASETEEFTEKGIVHRYEPPFEGRYVYPTCQTQYIDASGQALGPYWLMVEWSELVRTYERYDLDDAVAGGYQFVLESFTVP